jgi:uncharacterized protein HemX
VKDVLKVVGVGAACAVLCALPVLLPAVGLAGIGLGLDTWAVLALLGLGTAVGLIIQRRRAKAATCSVDGSCCCKE